MPNSTLDFCQSCGAPLDPHNPQPLCPGCVFTETVSRAPDTPMPGTIGGHLIIEEIARGGMGVVYLAKQADPERLVALKTLRATALNSPESHRRFRQEVRAMAALDHPAILPVYQFGEQDGVPYFTMKLATGGTLEKHQPLFAGKWREIATLMATVADAVQHAHSHTLLHRDLKPANILFDEEDRPHVADFGIAKLLDDPDSEAGLTRTSAVLGTPNYLSPEVASRDARNATTASDVWSLGVILYELLAQKRPFAGNFVPEVLTAILTRDPDPIPGAPRDLEVIALKALSKEPERRYPTARDMAADLQRWLDGRPITARPATLPERVLLWARRSPALAGLSALALLAALTSVASLFWAIHVGQREVANVRHANEKATENLRLAGESLRLADENLRKSLVSEARLLTRSGMTGQRDKSLETIRQSLAKGADGETRDVAATALAKVEIRLISTLGIGPRPQEKSSPITADLSRYLQLLVRGPRGVRSPEHSPDPADAAPWPDPQHAPQLTSDLSFYLQPLADDARVTVLTDSRTGTEIRRFKNQRFSSAFLISADNQRFAAISPGFENRDGKSYIEVWDMGNGKAPLAILDCGGRRNLRPFVFLPDGGWIYVNQDGALIRQDNDGTESQVFAPAPPREPTPGPRRRVFPDLSISPKGDLGVNYGSRAEFYRVSDGRKYQEGETTTGQNSAFVWHPGGESLFGIPEKTMLQLARISPAASLHPVTVSHLPGWTRDLAFDPTGRFLACQLDNGQLLIIDPQTCNTLLSHPSEATKVWFSDDGKNIATFSPRAGTLSFWEFSEGVVWHGFANPSQDREIQVGNLLQSRVPDVVLTESAGRIMAWDVAARHRLPGPVGVCTRNNRLFADPATGGPIYAQGFAADLPPGAPDIVRGAFEVLRQGGGVTIQAAPPSPIASLALIAPRPIRKNNDRWSKELFGTNNLMEEYNGKFLAPMNMLAGTTPHQSGWIVRNGRASQWQLWPEGQAEKAVNLAEAGHWAEEVAISPDGRWFALSNYKNDAWSALAAYPNGLLHTIQHGDGGALTLSRIGSPDKPAAIPTPKLNQLAFSPDSRWLLAIGHQVYHLHEVGPDGVLTRRLEVPMPPSGEPQFSFSPDGRQLALGDGLGNLRIYGLPGLALHLRFELPQTLKPGDILFNATGDKLFLHSAAHLYELDLKTLRGELAKLKLDWKD